MVVVTLSVMIVLFGGACGAGVGRGDDGRDSDGG